MIDIKWVIIFIVGYIITSTAVIILLPIKETVKIGQTWIKSDTTNPFEPIYDTITIVDIKKEYVLYENSNGYEHSNRIDNITKYYNLYK